MLRLITSVLIHRGRCEMVFLGRGETYGSPHLPLHFQALNLCQPMAVLNGGNQNIHSHLLYIHKIIREREGITMCYNVLRNLESSDRGDFWA